VTPWLDWQPTLEPEQVYAQPPAPQYPCRHAGDLYYLEQRAAEGGRSVLMRLHADGGSECLTPPDFNIRSRVHEYGGKAFVLSGTEVLFSNDADRHIYRQTLVPGSTPERLTRAEPPGMHADLQATPDARHLVFVHERERVDGENENRICGLSLTAGGDGLPYTLASGHDFYANPVIAPDGRHMAWIEWDHPDMPWDATRLQFARLEEHTGRLRLSGERTIAGGAECAVCQLGFGPDGALWFALDGADTVNGFDAEAWDLFRYTDGEVERVTHDNAEYGEAHWIFGQVRNLALGPSRIVSTRTLEGIDQLVLHDTGSDETRVLADGYMSIAQLGPGAPGEVLCVATAADRPPGILSWREDRGAVPLTRATNPLGEADISTPRQLRIPVGDDGESHAYYYPPCNDRHSPPAEPPPLLVLVHGGPTARSEAGFNLMRQYWTGRGFAILDVNHRGSTGYGRAYRQVLRGRWGLLETADVAAAVNHAVALGLAHPGRVCIRGGSAGGYEVLRALTEYPQLFRAGACYYGIGNLVTLMEHTHKFEARYLDGLLGEAYRGALSDRPGSAYYERSPIHRLERLACPMIVFQGLEDKVVPPSLSREIVAALEARGIYHQYIEYPGEGHGFRRQETRVDALEREAAFFVKVIGEQTD